MNRLFQSSVFKLFSSRIVDYIDSPQLPLGICILPKELDYSGYGMATYDCDDGNMDRYKKPPCTLFALKGSYPMVS